MKKTISVVVPAYNAEAYIERCLNSVLAQTYKQIDLIVINDGSTDGTKTVVEKISKEDGRVRLISIENAGVSHARNVGIDNARGEYITFVDADDFIDNEMYEHLMNLIIKHSSKIAHCSYTNDDEDGNVISIVGGKGKIVAQEHDEAITCLIDGKLFTGSLCNKLYDSTLFRKYRLDESIKQNEDVLLNYQLFDQVELSVYTDRPFYHYVALQESSTHSANGLESAKQCLYVSRIIDNLSQGKKYKKNAENKLVNCLLQLLREYVLVNNKSNLNNKKMIMKEISYYRKKGYLSNKKDKIQFFMYKYLPAFFLFFYKYYDKYRVKKLDPEQDYD